MKRLTAKAERISKLLNAQSGKGLNLFQRSLCALSESPALYQIGASSRGWPGAFAAPDCVHDVRMRCCCLSRCWPPEARPLRKHLSRRLGGHHAGLQHSRRGAPARQEGAAQLTLTGHLACWMGAARQRRGSIASIVTARCPSQLTGLLAEIEIVNVAGVHSPTSYTAGHAGQYAGSCPPACLTCWWMPGSHLLCGWMSSRQRVPCPAGMGCAPVARTLATAPGCVLRAPHPRWPPHQSPALSAQHRGIMLEQQSGGVNRGLKEAG